MKYCKRCTMPDTRPNLLFNDDGVCYACLNFDKRKSIDWDTRMEELRKVCDKYRRQDGAYDCLIPVSGGKDSHFLVFMLKEEMGMHPLLMKVADHFTSTEAGKHNLRNITETFDCDLMQFNMSPELFRQKTRTDFENEGHPLKYIEAEIYHVPHVIAKFYGLDFVMYGENPEYELGLTDKESSRNKDGDYFMSYFVPWDGRKNYELAKQYGFRDLVGEWRREGFIQDYDQIDSIGYHFHLWMKYPKFGYGNASSMTSLWVRKGEMTRDEAITLIKDHDYILDRRVMDDFCSFCGYTTRQLWEIIDKFWNRDLFQKVDGIWRLKHFPGLS